MKGKVAMAKRKKIDRHELKRDRFMEDIIKIYTAAKENPQKFITYAVVVVAVVAAIFGYLGYRSKHKKDAQEKLGLVYIMMSAEQYREAFDTLQSLVNNYGNTKPAKTATYLLAHLYYAFGYLDSAIALYQRYLSFEDKDSDLAAASLFGLGAIYEDKSRYDEAIRYYKQVVDSYPDFFRADEAMASMARCYELKGDPMTALKIYQEFLVRYPESTLTKRVKLFLARLEANLTPQIESQTLTKKPEG